MSELTVCVPAYNAETFVAETLDSLAGQTLSEIRVLVSLDLSEDASEGVVRRYLSDGRFELTIQPRRLGWVANVNFLIGRVETPFFCIIPHDDILHPDYLRQVLALAKSDPAIACAYSDIRGFGARELPLRQPDLRGDLQDRVLAFLLDHFNAVAFRGVVRRHGPDDRPYLPTGLPRDFAADTVWALQLALRGELRRVPLPLYAKRFDDGTVHAGWKKLPAEERHALWIEHTAICVETALATIPDAEQRELLLAAGLLRALHFGNVKPGFLAPGGSEIPAAATQDYIDRLGCPELPDRMAGILARPSAWRLREGIKRGLRRHRKPTLLERLRWRISQGALIADLRARVPAAIA